VVRIWEIIPNPGRIKIYTSGWPKNQNRCWNKIGSPPPIGSKYALLKFRSRSIIVIAPAKIGRAIRSRIVVNTIDQRNRGVRSGFKYLGRMFEMVEMKLIDAMIDEAPAI